MPYIRANKPGFKPRFKFVPMASVLAKPSVPMAQLSTELGDEYLALLEEHKRLLDEREQLKAKLDALDGKVALESLPESRRRWHSLLREKLQSGVPRSKAMKQMNAEYPALRQRIVAEANKAPPIKKFRPDSVQQRWNLAIQAREDEGKSRQQAVRDIVATMPKLHKAYLKAMRGT